MSYGGGADLGPKCAAEGRGRAAAVGCVTRPSAAQALLYTSGFSTPMNGRLR